MQSSPMGQEHNTTAHQGQLAAWLQPAGLAPLLFADCASLQTLGAES